MDCKTIEKIDAVIEKLADDIISDNVQQGLTADTVKALAELMEARAKYT